MDSIVWSTDYFARALRGYLLELFMAVFEMTGKGLDS